MSTLLDYALPLSAAFPRLLVDALYIWKVETAYQGFRSLDTIGWLAGHTHSGKSVHPYPMTPTDIESAIILARVTWSWKTTKAICLYQSFLCNNSDALNIPSPATTSHFQTSDLCKRKNYPIAFSWGIQRELWTKRLILNLKKFQFGNDLRSLILTCWSIVNIKDRRLLY